MTKHTILLVQLTQAKGSRTYNDYETVSLAMEGVLKMFEQRLRQQYPTLRSMQYDISDLYAYIDALGDLGVLVFEPSLNAYLPHDKQWVKQKLLKHLQKASENGQGQAMQY